MVREQLDASGGWVRCGHCMDVFDAKSQMASNEAITDETGTASFSFVQQAAKQAFWQRPFVRMALVLLCLALMMLLASQFLRTQRDRLSGASPWLVKLADQLCAAIPCTPIARLQIDGWIVDNSSFQKENNQQFRLGVLLKNTSRSQLLVPHLDVSLLDAHDTVLMRKSIDLSIDDSGKVITAASGEERKFDLLLTPVSGFSTITGYRLVLYYP